MGYDIVIRRYKIKKLVKYDFFDDLIKIKILSLKIVYVILHFFDTMNYKILYIRVFMPTHCIKKTKRTSNQAVLNEIKKWEDELLKSGFLPKYEDEEKIYVEGSYLECNEALDKLHHKAIDLFDIFKIDYKEE